MWRRGKEEKGGEEGGYTQRYLSPLSALSSDLGSRPYSHWKTKDLSVRDGVFQNTHKETLIHPADG